MHEIKELEDYDLIAIVGPTASGKTRHAVELAYSIGAEILSGDSRQVYRHMTIGTGKDLDEYGDVPYHLIDICDAGEKYNLHRYLKDFECAFRSIKDRNKPAILCGGSGMYLEAAISGITLPEVPVNLKLRKSLEGKSLEELSKILTNMKRLHNVTDIDTVKRAVRAIEIQNYYQDHPEEALLADKTHVRPKKTYIIGIDIPREDRRRRITERLQTRLEQGMIEEVANLLQIGLSPTDLIYYGLEYKFVTLYLQGELTYEEMFSKLETAIFQFAKRQMTWFRGMERRGFKIHWHPYNKPLTF